MAKQNEKKTTNRNPQSIQCSNLKTQIQDAFESVGLRNVRDDVLSKCIAPSANKSHFSNWRYDMNKTLLSSPRTLFQPFEMLSSRKTIPLWIQLFRPRNDSLCLTLPRHNRIRLLVPIKVFLPVMINLQLVAFYEFSYKVKGQHSQI